MIHDNTIGSYTQGDLPKLGSGALQHLTDGYVLEKMKEMVEISLK